MTRGRFSIRILARSLVNRRVSSLLVAGSLAVATAVVVALLCLSIDVQRKLTSQLAEFGANVALVPAGSESTLSAAAVEAVLAGLPPGTVASPILYSTAQLPEGGAASVLVAGFEPTTIGEVVKLRLDGRPLEERPPGTVPLPALVGGRLARRLGLELGASVPIDIHGQRVVVRLVGVMSTGDVEEDELAVPLRELEPLAGLVGRRSAVLVRVPGRPEEVARAVAAVTTTSQSHGIEAKILRRVAATAATALAKVSGLLAVLSLLVAAASLLSAGMVLMEQAVERQAEVGLMKSIGARNRAVASLVLGQAASLGLLGGMVGAALGLGTAEVLERIVFGADLNVPASAVPLGILMAIALALSAAALPLRVALGVQPALALREART